VPIVLVESEQLKLGLAANVADNVAVLGGTPLLVGVIGKDRAAADFRAILRESGIKATHLVTDAKRRTVLKERVVSDRQQLLRIDFESPFGVSGATEAQILARVTALLPRVDAVVIEDYAKGMLSKRLMQAVFKRARAHGLLVAVDPNAKTDLEAYRGATFLTPNTREAEALVGYRITSEATLDRAAREILARTGAEHVIITRGKEGMALCSKGSDRIDLIPTYAREVYDVSGAGDTVIAVLALAMATGASLQESAVLANLAAGVEVGKRGTATVTPDEIRVALEFFGSA
jgi:D-beta-D-heptose 7-phosphate kinase/D-beta-D-heptose 1-phosphate adenosyltransferase